MISSTMAPTTPRANFPETAFRSTMPKLLSEPTADEGAGDAQEDRDDEAAGVPARHQELRDQADHEADDQHPQEFHGTSAVQETARDHNP